jgi:hypothetical protein
MKELGDVKKVVSDMRDEWMINFPKEGHLHDPKVILTKPSLPPENMVVVKNKNDFDVKSTVATPKKIVAFISKRLDRTDDDINPCIERDVPDGRNYFKRKPEKI